MSRTADPASETQARIDLAGCYRLIAHFGWDDLIYTHISARVPGTHDRFLINPYGFLYEEITASSLVKVDLAGRIVENTPHSINPAGFIIHSAIHGARPDVGCIIHTHTPHGVALSGLEEGLLPLNQWSMQFHGRVAYHPYEGIAVDPDEQQRLIADIGTKDILILRNHGLLVCGRTIPDAFKKIYYLERCATAQLAAMAAGRSVSVPQPVIDKTAQQYAEYGRYERDGDQFKAGEREWQALRRLLDRRYPDYQT